MYNNYQDDGLAYTRHCDNNDVPVCPLCLQVDYAAMSEATPEPEHIHDDTELPCMCDWTQDTIDEYLYYYNNAVFARGI